MSESLDSFARTHLEILFDNALDEILDDPWVCGLPADVREACDGMRAIAAFMGWDFKAKILAHRNEHNIRRLFGLIEVA